MNRAAMDRAACPCCDGVAESVGGARARICRACQRKACDLYTTDGIDHDGAATDRYLRENRRRA